MLKFTNDLTDAALIVACQDTIDAKAAWHASVDVASKAEEDDLFCRGDDLLAQVIDMRATTPEGIRAKARVLGALYVWVDRGEFDQDLVVSMLLDLGVVDPYGAHGYFPFVVPYEHVAA